MIQFPRGVDYFCVRILLEVWQRVDSSLPRRVFCLRLWQQNSGTLNFHMLLISDNRFTGLGILVFVERSRLSFRNQGVTTLNLCMDILYWKDRRRRCFDLLGTCNSISAKTASLVKTNISVLRTKHYWLIKFRFKTMALKWKPFKCEIPLVESHLNNWWLHLEEYPK